VTLDQDGTPVTEVTQQELRRLHPLTPLFGSWRLLGLAGIVGYGAFGDDLSRLVWVWNALHGDAEIGATVKAALLLIALAFVSVFLGWVSWKTTGFAIVAEPGEPGTLLYHRGLFNRQRSQVRLKRVQSVDVNQPFVPRLFGLAVVRLDMAAGEGASVNLSYLGLGDAWALREEILRHTSGQATIAPADATPAPAPEPVIGHVDTGQLVRASLLDGIGVVLIFVLWVVVVVVIGVGWGWKALAAGLTGILPLAIAILAEIRKQVSTVLREADFTVMRTRTGIRTRAGLTSTTNRTVDFDRVQSIRIERPMLWRHFRWARVEVDVAGADAKTGASLMPVADDAVAVDLASDVAGEPVEPPGGMTADWGADLVPPGRRARLVDPLAAPWLGVALLGHGAVTRTGNWVRTVTYVPFARVQSVSVRQGWLQRRLGLATVCLDLPSGATRWQAPHRDVAEAASLVRVLTEQARSHRTPVRPSDAEGVTL
jgi:putative membrane protein